MPDGVVANDVLPAETCVVRYALERRAATKGNKVYAVFQDGERWTYADTLGKVRLTAAGLQALGIGRGDRVLIMLPNSALGIRTLFGVNYLDTFHSYNNAPARECGRQRPRWSRGIVR